MLKKTILLLGLISTVAGTFIKPNEANHVYAVILAGGKGERLWPLSRDSKPKQFLEFFTDTTLLGHTFNRITPLLSSDKVWVITNKAHESQVRTILGDTIGGIITEPMARDTAPAVLLACLTIWEQDPEATLLFLPADHYIKEEALFCHGLEMILTFLNNTQNHVVLLGLSPTYPATGYGYIEYNRACEGTLYKVNRFHEKPSLNQAQKYLEADNMLWNGGYFCGKASTFLDLFKKHTPLLFEQALRYLNNEIAYSELKSISFDRAIMEQADNVYVLPLEITWSDVGNLKTFLSLQNYSQDNLANVATVNASNNLIYNENQLTALIGIDDVCIINTGDVLLISHQKEVERVKEILLQLPEGKTQKLRSILKEIMIVYGENNE